MAALHNLRATNALGVDIGRPMLLDSFRAVVRAIAHVSEITGRYAEAGPSSSAMVVNNRRKPTGLAR